MGCFGEVERPSLGVGRVSETSWVVVDGEDIPISQNVGYIGLQS